MGKRRVGRIVVAIVAGLLAVASIAFVVINPRILLEPPPKRGFAIDIPAQCDAIGMPHGNQHRGSELDCNDKLEEAALLKSNPGLGVRQGDKLTLFYRGRQTFQMSDGPQGLDDCDVFSIHDVLLLFDPTTGRREAVPFISCHGGEFERRFVALPDGTPWKTWAAVASPDGHLAAVAGSNTLVFNWPDRKPVARFMPSCRPKAWQDNTHLTAVCFYSSAMSAPGGDEDPQVRGDDAIAFDARVWRGDEGKWHLQATRWLYPGMAGFDSRGDFVYVPILSLRFLPRFDAQ